MISPDVLLLAVMTVCGAAISVLFDMHRAFRRTFKPRGAMAVLGDIGFVLLSFLTAVACVWNFGDGKFRFYELTGLGLGCIFYFLLIGRYFLRAFVAVNENILKLGRFIFKLLLTPSRFLYKILVAPTHRYADSIQQRRKKAHDKRIQRAGSRFFKRTQKRNKISRPCTSGGDNGISRRHAAAADKRGKGEDREPHKTA